MTCRTILKTIIKNKTNKEMLLVELKVLFYFNQLKFTDMINEVSEFVD